jgi:hypothetical protein
MPSLQQDLDRFFVVQSSYQLKGGAALDALRIPREVQE